MNIQLTLKNYRCFDEAHPARFSLHEGFTSFVGVNNSGKSTLLKFFYEFRDMFRLMAGSYNEVINGLYDFNPSNSNFPRESVYDRTQLFNNGNNKDITIELTIDDIYQKREDGIPYCLRTEITIRRSDQYWKIRLGVNNKSYLTFDYQSNLQWNGCILTSRENVSNDCRFIQEAFSILQQGIYIGPFRNAINIGSKDNYFDIQIGQSFIQAWRTYQAGNDSSLSHKIYELTTDIERLFGFSRLEIHPSIDDQTLHFFIDGKSYKLAELGSGIAQFVLVLTNIAVKNPSIILIDEPELNLHPSLQIDFLTTLSSYARFGTIFATHSIGLARATSEHIYTVRKEKNETKVVSLLESIPRLSEFLGELSFAGYRDIGYEKILLVEGSTEVKTFHQLLRKYQKDHKVIVLPLGGSDLIKDGSEAELSEILRITKDVNAVIDSEKEEKDAELPMERVNFQKLCKKLGINCKILEFRATENYFTESAIKGVKGSLYKQLQPYESLKKKQHLGWSKSENWRIAAKMTKEELDNTDLGGFLESL